MTSSKRGSKRSRRTSNKSNNSNSADTAIVFDPDEQKLYKDSIQRVQSEQNKGKYTKIQLPRISKSVECYVEAKQGQKVSMGTVNLSKLGWQLNTKRVIFGQIKDLYVLGKFQAPQ